MIVKEALSMKEVLKDVFGFDNFKGNQEIIIKHLLSRKDTFVIMPTGGGKSLCYQLPAMMCEGTAIIVSPLIALMKNQVDNLRNYGTDHNLAHFMNSSLSKSEMKEVRQDLVEGYTKLLYVAPESLTKEDNVEFLRNITYPFMPSMKPIAYRNGVTISGLNTAGSGL